MWIPVHVPSTALLSAVLCLVLMAGVESTKGTTLGVAQRDEGISAQTHQARTRTTGSSRVERTQTVRSSDQKEESSTVESTSIELEEDISIGAQSESTHQNTHIPSAIQTSSGPHSHGAGGSNDDNEVPPLDYDRWYHSVQRKASKRQKDEAWRRHRDLSEKEAAAFVKGLTLQGQLDSVDRAHGLQRLKVQHQHRRKMSLLIGLRNDLLSQLPLFWYSTLKDGLKYADPPLFGGSSGGASPSELQRARDAVSVERQRSRTGKPTLYPGGLPPLMEEVMEAERAGQRIISDQEFFAQFLKDVQCFFLPHDTLISHRRLLRDEEDVAAGRKKPKKQREGAEDAQEEEEEGIASLTTEYANPTADGQSIQLPPWASQTILVHADDDDLQDENDDASSLNIYRKPSVERVTEVETGGSEKNIGIDSGAKHPPKPPTPEDHPRASASEHTVELPAELQHDLSQNAALTSHEDRFRLVLRFRQSAFRLDWMEGSTSTSSGTEREKKESFPTGYQWKDPKNKNKSSAKKNKKEKGTTKEEDDTGDGELSSPLDTPLSQLFAVPPDDRRNIREHLPLGYTELVKDVYVAEEQQERLTETDNLRRIMEEELAREEPNAVGAQSSSSMIPKHKETLGVGGTVLDFERDRLASKVRFMNNTVLRMFLSTEEFNQLSEAERRTIRAQLHQLVSFACRRGKTDPLQRYESREKERKWRQARKLEEAHHHRTAERMKSSERPTRQSKDGERALGRDTADDSRSEEL